MAFLSGKSKLTQKTYLGVLKEFLDFLNAKDISYLLKVNQITAARYLSFLRTKFGIPPRVSDFSRSSSTDLAFTKSQISEDLLLAPASIRKKISILRKIYKVLEANGLTKTNPFLSELISTPKAGSYKRPTEMLQFDVIDKLINSTLERGSPASVRDACILAFLFGLGLRRGEVVKILLSDLKVSPNKTKYVVLRRTKSGRDFEMPLNDFVKNYLELWLDQRDKNGINSIYLFPASSGRGKKKFNLNKPISTMAVWRLFKTACARVGLPNIYSPHSARATAITRLLQMGFNFKEVQSFSRHSSIAMVEVYDKRRLSIEENPGLKLKY